MPYEINKSDRLRVVRIVAIYAIFSGLWVYFSDSVFGLLARDVATMTRLSIVKGAAFIILTALLLYRLILRHTQKTREAEKRILELNKAMAKSNEELERLLTRMKLLFESSVKITGQTELTGLLTTIAEAARKLVGARYCATGHGYVNGRFVTGVSRARKVPPIVRRERSSMWSEGGSIWG